MIILYAWRPFSDDHSRIDQMYIYRAVCILRNVRFKFTTIGKHDSVYNANEQYFDKRWLKISLIYIAQTDNFFTTKRAFYSPDIFELQ